MTVLFFKRNKSRGRAARARGMAEDKLNLYGLKKGDRATVVSVGAKGGAEARLHALGIVSGAEIEVLAYSLFRSSVLISCASVRVGMRRTLAEKIAVRLI